MSLRWQWKDFWGWFEHLESSNTKSDALKELNKDKWLARLSPEIQAEVMEFAPNEIINSLQHFPDIFSNRGLYLIIQKNRKRKK